jgi:hypothetical protein
MTEFFSQSYKNLLAYLAGKPINVINAAHPFLPESQVAKQMHKSPLHSKS